MDKFTTGQHHRQLENRNVYLSSVQKLFIKHKIKHLINGFVFIQKSKCYKQMNVRQQQQHALKLCNGLKICLLIITEK